MTIIIDRHGIRGDLMGDIAALESLLRDMNRIEDGNFPMPEELERAPLIDRYLVAPRQVGALVGQIHGHPHVKGPVSVTSELWVLAEHLGWARTYSRFYRLGQRFKGWPQ